MIISRYRIVSMNYADDWGEKHMKENLIAKLTSRKFVVTIITAIAGVITLIVGDSEIVNIIAGAAMTIIPTVIYCIVEGKIDAESVKVLTDSVSDAAEKLGASEPVVDVIEQVGAIGELLADSDKIE